MPPLRRALRIAAFVVAIAVAYVGGVVTGVVGEDAPPARPGVIDEAANRIAERAATPVSKEALERAAVEGMLREVGDRWSSYYPATDYASFEDALEGHYAGVGLWLRPSTVGGVEVGSVQASSPAAAARLRPGDLVVAVDGHDVHRGSVSEVATLLRGQEQTTVRVGVRRGDLTRTVTLTRATFLTDDVVVERLSGNIYRVQVRAFTRGVGRQIRDAVDSIHARNAAGIVLDLRDDPGGLLDEAVEVASVFLDGGPVVSYERRGRPPKTLEAFPGGDVATPLVVLVNQVTASSAEIVAAAMQDRNRAVVVGSRTFGKGSVQEPSRLSDGSALELTVGRYVTAGGRDIEGVGVEPDIVVPPDEPSSVAERRAIEVLSGLVAALDGDGPRLMAKDTARKMVAQNRKARHDYHIDDVFEAGLVLTGTEVKSLRAGQASLVDGYAHIRDGEVWLAGVHIPEYTQGTWTNHTPRRERKLLLHRQEIQRLIGKTKETGVTLVPLALYFKNGVAKVEIALARGKRSYDKRVALAEKQARRETERALARRNRA